MKLVIKKNLKREEPGRCGNKTVCRNLRLNSDRGCFQWQQGGKRSRDQVLSPQNGETLQ